MQYLTPLSDNSVTFIPIFVHTDRNSLIGKFPGRDDMPVCMSDFQMQRHVLFQVSYQEALKCNHFRHQQLPVPVYNSRLWPDADNYRLPAGTQVSPLDSPDLNSSDFIICQYIFRKLSPRIVGKAFLNPLRLA